MKARLLTPVVQMPLVSLNQLDLARFLAARARSEIQARRMLSVRLTPLHPLEQISFNRAQQQILFLGAQVHLARTSKQPPLLVPIPAPVSRSLVLYSYLLSLSTVNNGTGGTPYTSFNEKEPNTSVMLHYQSINCLPVYQNYSLEVSSH